MLILPETKRLFVVACACVPVIRLRQSTAVQQYSSSTPATTSARRKIGSWSRTPALGRRVQPSSPRLGPGGASRRKPWPRRPQRLPRRPSRSGLIEILIVCDGGGGTAEQNRKEQNRSEHNEIRTDTHPSEKNNYDEIDQNNKALKK